MIRKHNSKEQASNGNKTEFDLDMDDLDDEVENFKKYDIIRA